MRKQIRTYNRVLKYKTRTDNRVLKYNKLLWVPIWEMCKEKERKKINSMEEW